MTDQQIAELAFRFEVGDRESNDWGFAWHDFARAILTARDAQPTTEAALEWLSTTRRPAGEWGQYADVVLWADVRKAFAPPPPKAGDTE